MVAARPRLDRRSTTLVIAAVLALGTGLLTFNYLTSIGRHQSAVVAPRAVLVAVRDIPARVPITRDMLIVVMRPGDAVEPDALNDPASAVGRVAAVSVPSGGTVTSSKVVATVNATLGTRIPRGLRGLSIPVDRVKGVGNLVQPGDHVDVIAVLPARPGTAPRAATVLRDVPVLAMGTALETPQGATPAPDNGFQTATLAVTPAQAKMLTTVDLSATLRLSLRGSGDVAHRPMAGEKLDMTIPAPPQPRTAAAAPAPAAPAPAAAPVQVVPAAAKPAAPSGPQIISGDKVLR